MRLFQRPGAGQRGGEGTVLDRLEITLEVGVTGLK